MNKRIAIISCVSKKLDTANQAKDLYISDLFKKAYAYTNKHFDQVLILSAKYGCIDPGRVIEPYDVTLNNFSTKQKKEWAFNAYTQLLYIIGGNDYVYWFCGMNYRKYLMELVKNHQEEPLKGLGIGQQLQYFKNNL